MREYGREMHCECAVCVCAWRSTRVVGLQLSAFDAVVLGGVGLSTRVACRRRATPCLERSWTQIVIRFRTRSAVARRMGTAACKSAWLAPLVRAPWRVARRRHAARALSPTPPKTLASKAESCSPTTRVERHTHARVFTMHLAPIFTHSGTQRTSAYAYLHLSRL